MGNEGKTEKPTKWQRAVAPFSVLKVEKVYWFWLASYCISFAGIIIDLFNHNIKTSIENGMVFSTCIAVLAPLVLEFFINYIVKNRKEEKEQFSSYIGVTYCVCVLGILLNFLFYVTNLKSSIIVQGISFVCFLAVSFYAYLVTKMATWFFLKHNYRPRL